MKLNKLISKGCFKGKVRQKKYSFYMHIEKSLARDVAMKKGDEYFYYNCEDEKGRPILVVFMDGKNKYGRNEK